MIKERTFNPKKHTDQRRKRPKYREGDIPKAVWVPIKRISQGGVAHITFVEKAPQNPPGMNRQAYRVDIAKQRKAR